jgi:DNA polymerase IV
VTARDILHVDLDAFYASVEQRDDPSLRGKPVIVGGHRTRGVVLAASYEARPFGVRSAMPMVRALAACPRAVVIPPRMHHYADVSEQFFAILRRFTPLVEGLSLDEAFLDVTGERRLFGDGPTIARAIKQAVRDELALVASVGVATCKFAAKIASDVGKPDGLVVVDELTAFLHPLPVGRLWGVGQVTEAELRALGIATIGDVARADGDMLARRLGRDTAEHLRALARGDDPRDVVPDRMPVSIGHEDTFDSDCRAREQLAKHLLDQADRACARLRAHGFRARTVTVKVKYADHVRVSRRETLPRATSDARVVGRVTARLLAAVPDVERRGVRLTGVSLSGLTAAGAPRQLVLDEREAERGEQLGATLDRIAGKFGRAAVQRAVLLGDQAVARDVLRSPLMDPQRKKEKTEGERRAEEKKRLPDEEPTEPQVEPEGEAPHGEGDEGLDGFK